MKTQIKKEMLSELFCPTLDFEPFNVEGTLVDYCEIVIAHEGIQKLERNIDNTSNEKEYIVAYIYFNAGTAKVNKILLEVRSESSSCPLSVNKVLTEEEKEVIINYALELVHKARIN